MIFCDDTTIMLFATLLLYLATMAFLRSLFPSIFSKDFGMPPEKSLYGAQLIPFAIAILTYYVVLLVTLL